MPTLFDPLTAGELQLANRVVMAPLTRNRSPNGVPLPMTARYYRQRAGAGLIVSEAVAISQQGQGYADVPGLYTEAQLRGWREVAREVHAAGGLIVAQLWHVGRISHTSLQPGGQAPVAPSALRAAAKTYLVDARGKGEFAETSEPRALRLDEIPGIVEDYRRAALAARAAGFDGVEIHAANGYLIDQFLRSGSNLRTDAYGGAIEHRARLLVEVVAAVAEAVGAGRTGIRISPVTPANDARDPEPQPLFHYVVERLAAYDLAYVHIIEGATGGDRDYRQGEHAFDYAALHAAYVNAGGQAAWMVNNGYDGASAEAAIANGHTDLVAFGKAFLANPDLVERLRMHAPLNTPDRGTFYGGGEKGYTDYPRLDEAVSAP